jgi:hypothetical protein
MVDGEEPFLCSHSHRQGGEGNGDVETDLVRSKTLTRRSDRTSELRNKISGSTAETGYLCTVNRTVEAMVGAGQVAARLRAVHCSSRVV